MFFYLAHPIDQQLTYRESLMSAIGHLHNAASQQGHVLFRPGSAYKLPAPPWSAEITARVDAINRNALWESDGVIAVIPPGVPTLGVPAEIEQALLLNRPTLIITTSRLYYSSIQIQGWERRGCRVGYMDDTGHINNLNLAEQLGSLPDPTQLVLDEATEKVSAYPPPLLVSGQAANLTAGRYEGDAGLDLAISAEAKIRPGEYTRASTGVHVAIPQGWYGQMAGRSSTWEKHRCWVRPAVIDAGYRGELMVGIENRGDQTVAFEQGTRLAQLILLPVFQGLVERVDQLPPADRGVAGYGSTGH